MKAGLTFLSAAAALAVSCAVGFAAPIVQNNSFENPALGSGFREGNPPTSWTAVGSSGTSGGGIVTNGSAYGNTAAPDGTQALLLKNSGGVTQQLSGFTQGSSYTISFDAEVRGSTLGPNPIQVLVDGTALSINGSTTLSPASSSAYTAYTTAPFTAGSATPTLEFLGLATTDLSSFIDLVTVTPEPASLGLLGFGAFGLLARRRTA